MPSSARKKNVCRSEEHTSELQSLTNLVCRLLLEKNRYESYAPSAEATRATAWNEGMLAGEEFGCWPVGLASRNTVRLERGLCVYGFFFLNNGGPPESPPFPPHTLFRI